MPQWRPRQEPAKLRGWGQPAPPGRSPSVGPQTHAPSYDRRQRAALLRGGRQRHPHPFRARICRRLSQLGAAIALFRAPLSLYCLQRPRLPALRGPGARGGLLAGARRRGYPLSARSAQDRHGPCRRFVHGWARRLAFRPHLPRTGALAVGRRGRLWFGAGRAGQVSQRGLHIAGRLDREGMQKFAEAYAYGPTRVQFEHKDPRGFAEFKQMLAEHSATGSIGTQLGVQRERPSLFDLEDKLKALKVPMLVVTGDEDWPCLVPNLYLKRTCTSAALLVLPNSGHAVNLEEPGLFNAALADFLAQVDAGRWPVRDPRAISQSITGMTKAPDER